MATNTKLKPQARYLIGLLLLVILLYVVIPQLGIFKQTPSILRKAEIQPLIFAVLFSALTYFAAAGNYYFLAFKKLPYLLSVIVQYGAMFLNRLLPAGIGTMGANFLYLKNKKHTDAQATAVIGLNNLVTLIGNTLIIIVSLVFLPENFTVGNKTISAKNLLYAVAGIIIVSLVVALIVGKKKLLKFVSEVGKSLASYKSRPLSVIFALGSSILITLFNTLAFMFCLQALGINLPFAIVVLILTFGVSTGAATPTPGGLGGFEAGLAAALVAYGIDKSTALAAALLYRLISYWLMFIFGAVAFMYTQKKNLLIQ